MLPKKASEIKNGGVYRQLIRCGKPKCKCVSGELHEGFYFMRRFGGRLRKTYIRKRDVGAFSRLVEEARANREHERFPHSEVHRTLKAARAALREIRSIINSKAISAEHLDASGRGRK
jgi:hypothetical protein